MNTKVSAKIFWKVQFFGVMKMIFSCWSLSLRCFAISNCLILENCCFNQKCQLFPRHFDPIHGCHQFPCLSYHLFHLRMPRISASLYLRFCKRERRHQRLEIQHQVLRGNWTFWQIGGVFLTLPKDTCCYVTSQKLMSYDNEVLVLDAWVKA